MRPSALFSALLLSTFTLGAEPGNNFTHVEQGSFPVERDGQVKISVPGNVKVRGAKGAQFTYKLRRTVRADTKAQAQQLLAPHGIRFTRQGKGALFQVAQGPYTTDIEITIPRTLQSSIVETPGGNLDIAELDGGLVAEAGAGRIMIGRIGGNVEIRTAGGPTTLGPIGGLVRCLSGGGPITADVIRGDGLLQTGGGDIFIRQADGQIRAYTAGGGIHVVEARSLVIANTVGGPIQIDRALGAVTANNNGGPIQIGSAPSVHCESASGTIRLTNVSGSMQAATAAGSIIAQFLPGLPVVESFLSTGAGDITVLIPSNLQISIRAQSEGSGNVRTVVSEFPGLRVSSVGSAVFAEGKINGGGPLLRLAGNGGRIYIKKQ